MLKSKFIAILLVLSTMFLVACDNKTVSEESKADASSSKVESSTVVSEETTSNSVTEDKSEEDILLRIDEKGKELTTLGEFTDKKYTAALSELERLLKSYGQEASLVAFSLDNQKALYFNSESEIFAACTIKAAYALYCCQEMEKGNGSLDTMLTYSEKHFESGSGDLQLSPFGTQFSLKTLISKSLNISDNVAYMMMVDYFGRDGYNQWVKDLGCPSLMIEPTVWSLNTKARDLAFIWREIYNYFNKHNEYSELLYDSCTNTQNNYLTASLKDVKSSHKEGYEDRGEWLSLSDAGIIWKDKSPYIVALITNAPGLSHYDAQFFANVMRIMNENLF